MKTLLGSLITGTILAFATPSLAADLTIWGLQSFNPQADKVVAELAKQFGKERGIDVEYVVVPGNVMSERLAAAFEGKAAPDVFAQVGQQAQYYASLGLTEPLDDVVANMRGKSGGIYEGIMPQAMYEGQAHAVPLEVDVFPMFARTDLLKEAGLEIPKTWDELRAAAKAITEKNPQVAGLGITLSNANDAEMQMRMLVWSFGGAMFSEDGKTATWNTPETVAAYQYIADMFAADEDETEQALTEADVRAAAEALLKRRGGATLRRLLSSIFDARRISEVPEARWAEFVKAANAE